MGMTQHQNTEYKIGDAVRKKGDKGQWHGFIVGTYSTKCTPEGYAVESVYEENSVQIYPASALEPWSRPQEVDVEALKGELKMEHPTDGCKALNNAAGEIISWTIEHLAASGYLSAPNLTQESPNVSETGGGLHKDD